MCNLGGCYYRVLFFAILVFARSTQSQAQLAAVGPIDPTNGFPLWYRDSTRLSLQHCLSQTGFCFTAEPNANLPISFPDNFGDEGFYFRALADLSVPGGGRALLALALESSFLNGKVVSGDQIVFARVRIRVDTLQAGTHKVIHPYGQETFPSVAAGTRAINFTEDVGIGAARNFEAALKGRIGPFLVSTKGIVTDALGEPYIANPNIPTLVTGSSFGTNFFRIEGPGIGGPGVDFLQTDQFRIMGKILTAQQAPSPNPVATNDSATTTELTPVVIDVLANDSPGSVGNPINPATVRIATPPLHGTTSVNPVIGAVTYTPSAGFVGNDTFTYDVRDTQHLLSNPGSVTVKVTIFSPPFAVDDMVTTFQNTPVLVDILGNDLLGSGGLPLDPATVRIASLPSNGEVRVDTSDGKVTYSSHHDFLGSDAFTYVVQDIGKAISNSATVTVTIKEMPISGQKVGLAAVGPVNSASGFPLWYQDRNGLALEHCRSQSEFCLANFSGPGSPPSNFANNSYYFVASSSLDLPGGGHAFLLFALQSGLLNETPGANAEVTFGRVQIQMDMPQSGTYQVIHPYGEDTFSSRATAKRAINFIEEIGGTVAGDFSLATNGRIGPFLMSSEGAVMDSLGELYLADPTQLVTITGSPFDTNFFRIEGPDIGGPGIDFIETDRFMLLGKIFTAEVFAVDDSITTMEDNPVIIDVLENDLPGIRGNPIDRKTLKVIDGPSSGTAGVDLTDGRITYTPKAFFFGKDTFTYMVEDTAKALSKPATVTVTVTFVNHAPLAVDDTVEVMISKPIEINVLVNDKDPDNNMIPESVSIVTPPSFGEATVDRNGLVTYISTPQMTGTDILTYNVKDQEGAVSNIGTVAMVPIQKRFIRCDANSSGVVDISDGISVLMYLFSGSGIFTCLDALDSDDSGIINLTDAIFILRYLFLAGAYPLPPFPNPGIDPTEEDKYLCR
jgi:hypothetical protein